MNVKKQKDILENYRLLSKLGEGSFGKIYKAVELDTNNHVAIKVENYQASNSQANSQLNIEKKVYRKMNGIVLSRSARWPKMHNYGKDSNGNNVLVMDLLGPNIDIILKKSLKNHFSYLTVAFFAEKMINLVEKLHENGFVHRDLKPQNFVIEYHDYLYPKYPELFLIDYGLAKTFVESDNKTHSPFTQKKNLKGTVRYASINTHLGIDQSRRDDLQSLVFILVYMSLGKLPWQNLMKSKDKKEGYHQIMIKKMSTPIEELVKDIPEPLQSAIKEYSLYVNSLMFEEEPHYEFCKSFFSKISCQFRGNIFKTNI